MMKQLFSLYHNIIAGGMIAMIAVLLLFASANTVHADTAPAQTQDASSCNMDQYGFTIGLMYCVKQAICNGVVGENCDGSAASSGNTTGMLQALTTGLSSYKYAVMILVLSLFGLKAMSLSGEEILRDGMMMMLKIAIALYVVAEAPSLFLSLMGAIDQMISWVSEGFATVTVSCTSTDTSPPGVDPTQYKVWQEFDCIFTAIFGATTDPKAVLGSMLIIFLPAIFKGTLGIFVFMLGINTIFSIIFMFIRSLYLVLLSYITVAFMMMLAPLIAPLLMFNSQQTSDFFKGWVSIILSTLFQPMFVIAFLSMAVMAMDTFIEGNIAGCVVGDPSASPPQAGSGVCSFKQLFNPNGTGLPTATDLQNKYMEQGATLVKSTDTGDPQVNSTNGQAVTADALTKKIKAGSVTGIDQNAAVAGSLDVQGITQLKSNAPLLQFIVTLIAFCIVTILMKNLLEVVVTIARQITVSTGIALGAAAVPLESTFEAAGAQMNKNMMATARSGGGFTNIVGSGIGGAIRGALSDLGSGAEGNVAESGISRLDSFSGGGGDGGE